MKWMALWKDAVAWFYNKKRKEKLDLHVFYSFFFFKMKMVKILIKNHGAQNFTIDFKKNLLRK